MIPPKHRPIVAGVFGFVCLVPILTMGTLHGKTQGTKNEAENQRQDRLEAVAKASLSNNCYINPAAEIVVGAEFKVNGRAQSVCVTLKDNSRYGFIEYQKGVLTIVDAFSQKEVNAKISTLGVKSK
jgi:hypothetical protein